MSRPTRVTPGRAAGGVIARALTERLELAQVEAGLRAGMSWQDVADALGVSRQAVHKKYAKRIDPTIPVPRRAR